MIKSFDKNFIFHRRRPLFFAVCARGMRGIDPRVYVWRALGMTLLALVVSVVSGVVFVQGIASIAARANQANATRPTSTQ